MLSNIFDRVSFYALLLVIVLLPIFVLPASRIPVETGKGFIVVTGLVISLVAFIAARIKEGKLAIPKSYILGAGVVAILVTLASSLFSSSKGMSFFGVMFDSGSFWFLFVGFLLTLLSALIIRDEGKARLVLLGVLSSLLVVFLFQALRIAAPSLFSLGLFSQKADSLIGSWNTFGFMAGFAALFSAFLIEFFQVSKVLKWLLIALMFVSLASIALVDFVLIWILLGFFALVFFVYKASIPNEEGKDSKNFPHFFFVLVLLSLLFIISPRFLGNFLPNQLGVEYAEVRPSWGSTLVVGERIVDNNFLLGIGPNRFSDAWAHYKPQSVNISQFWDMVFGTGTGAIPSIAVSTGALGILSWGLLVVSILVAVIKSLSAGLRKRVSLEYIAFALGATYLLFVLLFYSPSSVAMFLFFAFIGIFIGIAQRGDGSFIQFDFSETARKKFVATLFMVVLMLGSLGAYFKYLERLASVHYYNKAFAVSSIDEAQAHLGKAISFNPNDLYLRTFIQAYFTKLNTVLGAENTALSEEQKVVLQNEFTSTLNAAGLAIKWNKENYLNYQALAMLYVTAGLSGSPDSFNQAIQTYLQAATLNPSNPRLQLEIARLHFALGDLTKARDFASNAVRLKGNYLEGLLVLAEIEVKSGNKTDAVFYAEQALSLSPNNESLRNYVESVRKGAATLAPSLDAETQKDETETSN